MSTTVERMLPLYEGKMIHQFDHRWASYGPSGKIEKPTSEEKLDPEFRVLPRYWVRDVVADERLPRGWGKDWLPGWRDICRSTDERTLIATVVGGGARPEGGLLLGTPKRYELVPFLIAVWNSFVVDYVARQMVGGTHLKYFTMRQLPIIEPAVAGHPAPWSTGQLVGDWLGVRSVALMNSSVDMTEFAADVGVNPTRNCATVDRDGVRAELDAACFHLYGVERDDVDYIMETFPIVKRKDVTEFGEYRTKRMILDVYDQMAEAIATRVPYSSPFDADGEAAAHG